MKTKTALLKLGVLILVVSLGITGFYLLSNRNADSSTGKVRVACVGDSITEITGYPENLSRLLGEGYDVGNFGFCGSKVSLDSDNPYMYSEAFQDAIQFQPDIVVVMLGTNDASLSLEQFRGNFVDDYLTLLQRFQSLPHKPQIWIVKPPPVFNETLGLGIEAFDCEIIPAIEQVAVKAGLPTIDVYSKMGNSTYFVDGVHPNAVGAKVIAQTVSNTITAAQQPTPK